MLCMWRTKVGGPTELSLATPTFGASVTNEFEGGARLRLAAHEAVLDVLWQAQAADSWPAGRRAMIGVLTSHRYVHWLVVARRSGS